MCRPINIGEHVEETASSSKVSGGTVIRGSARNRSGIRHQRCGRPSRPDLPAEDNANNLISSSGSVSSNRHPAVTRPGSQDIICNHPGMSRDEKVTPPLETCHLFIT